MTCPLLASDACVHAHWSGSLRLGMPHLGMVGLSEEWLLRHLGHIHWEMLEHATLQRSPAWADGGGRRLYASFVALEVSGSLLSTAREGDEARIECALERIGTSVYASRHQLTVAGRPDKACVEMVTIFVRRLDSVDNAIFERASDGPTIARGPAPTRRPLSLLDDHRELRRIRASSPVMAQETYPLRAHEDFNAAGMVYFANYPRFVNRLLLAADSVVTARALRRRRCFYYGNLNHGDLVCAESLCTDGLAATTRLRRLPDGYPVALFETEWQ